MKKIIMDKKSIMDKKITIDKKTILGIVLDKRKRLIAGFYMILGILLLVFLISGIHRKHNSKAAADGEAYIAAEAAKDPAAVQAAMQGRGDAGFTDSLQDSAALQDPAAVQNPDTGITSDAGTNANGIQDPANGMTDPNQAAWEETENTVRAEVQAQMGPLYQQIESLEIPPMSTEQLAAYQQIFANTVVVGDSMAQAVYDYGFLDGNHVYFIRGEAIGNLGGQVDEAMAMLPSSVIFFSGLNGTDYYETPELYAQAYAERINQVLAINPNTRVFVCSMTPPSNELAVYREDLARSPEYDAALQNLCASSTAIYMDLNWMVRQQLYLPDGIHFGEEFYTVWMQYAALFINR
ncbi:MAG: hypothetical protein MJ117_11670 [Lachnospiraceae bacterium]|nr:hypothetical protein [Lachnospiraceae bacterium]